MQQPERTTKHLTQMTSVSSVAMLFRSVTAIVLAAGGSTRFGSPKQIHMHKGKTLLQKAIAAAMDAGADPIIVVLGAEAEAVEQTLGDSPVRMVVNKDWATGLASSLATGLRAVDSGCAGVLVTLADQPLVDANALSRLIAVFDSQHRIVASGYNGTVGVPAIFGVEFRDALSQLSGDTGAGHWLRERLSDVTVVRLDEGGIDVDTPSDVERLEETMIHE